MSKKEKLKEKKKKVEEKRDRFQSIWYKTNLCEKCKQETGATHSTFQWIIIYIGFLLVIIPGLLLLAFWTPNTCKCCGAKYGKTNFPNQYK